MQSILLISTLLFGFALGGICSVMSRQNRLLHALPFLYAAMLVAIKSVFDGEKIEWENILVTALVYGCLFYLPAWLHTKLKSGDE
jgi:peptidoglycan/LPS O-acetylase OafA/YrhL